MRDFDVIVIGCGPAGQKAAIKCAKVGRRTAIIDKRQVVGGQCLHIGTIPSKTLRAAIIFLSGYYDRKVYGAEARPPTQITARDLVHRCKVVIDKELNVIHNQLERNHVQIVAGDAHFLDPHTVRVMETVGSSDYSADYFVLATGSVQFMHYPMPFDGIHILNTDDILEIQFLPKKLALIGGGVIGLEYASMLALLGIEVHVISQYNTLLPWVDRQLVAELQQHMSSLGTVFHFEESLTNVHVRGQRKVISTLESTGEEFECEMVLYAGQRWGNTSELNLAAAGLEAGERHNLMVDKNYQTAVPHIYAAGDVIGPPSLAATSIDQGRKAANHLLGLKDVPYQPLFPYGIYTFPDMSMVGASEEQLKKDNRPYLTGIGFYRDTARAQMIGDDTGLCKLLFEPDTRDLLGVHIIGYEATELIHMGQAAMILGGKLDYFLDSVFNYPTMAEVYKLAALNGINKCAIAYPHN
jgi:NAD(P) transhydrogenase